MSKTISLSDLALLKKMMGLTSSEHDHEALAALRKANALLRKSDMSWEDIFSRTVSTVAAVAPLGDPVAEPEEMSLDQQITTAFNYLRGVDLGSFGSFKSSIDSLESQYNERKWLTAHQRKPLFEAYQKHKKRMND